MRVIITGATGFIGKALSNHLIEADFEVVALTRNIRTAIKILGDRIISAEWDGKTAKGWLNHAEGAFAIINLAGENIAGSRWTKVKKIKIIESRLNAGKAVVEAVKGVQKKPKLVIQSSGIGYYGEQLEETVDETFHAGAGFLPEVAKKWENSTKEVESFGVRHVVIRTGIVLGREGGALPRLVLPFRFFLGGYPGSGEQYFSWIHLLDEVRAIRYLMEKEDLNGAFNLTAPGSIKMRDFYNILGKVMGRSSWLPVPAFLLRMIYGQMAEETILTGQKATPRKLLKSGFEFGYPEVETALKEILKK